MLNNIVGVLGVGGGVATNFDSIATNTLTSNQTNITFSSIAGTYKHLQLRFMTRNNRASQLDGIYLRFNSDTASNYSEHFLRGDGATASAGATAPNSWMLSGNVAASNAGANIYGVGVIDILEYANTNINKTIRSLTGFDNNGSGYVGLFSGNWRSTSAVTSITIGSTDGTGLLSGSTFALYGIKA